MARDPSNADIARIFSRVADLLAAQRASVHRVRAWRSGAEAVLAEARPLADVFRTEGHAGLDAIPHIGRGLAGVIIEVLRSGHARILDRLEGEVSAIDVLSDLPGLGPELARRAHEELGVSTLEELEQAAHDGRLARVRGFGERRLRAIRDQLAARLAQGRRRTPGERPPVALLLEMDRRYRELAAAGRLPRIAPRRMNPGREAWLPILHEDRGGWHFTVLYSNTPRAHDLGKVHDWVVVYHERGGDEGRATVVTETSGPRRGERVVRGRELESEAAGAEASASPV